MDGWSIGEVGRRTGLATSAIRYYEDVGLLPVPFRRAGRRVYDPSILPRLEVIALAQRGGFTIREVRELLHGFGRRTPPSARWRALTERKLAEVEARIREAHAMRAVLRRLQACMCPTLADCGLEAREFTSRADVSSQRACQSTRAARSAARTGASAIARRASGRSGRRARR
jgi:MerR family redox-sensitive transcriptional activator SoxR